MSKDVKYEIGYNLVRWVYTDFISENVSKCTDDFYLEMMRQANRFGLVELKNK